MIPVRVLLLRTRNVTVNLGRQVFPQVFHKLPGAQVNLRDKRKIQREPYVFSSLPEGQVNLMDMQSVSRPETDMHIVELETSMEHDSKIIPTPVHNALADVSTEEVIVQPMPSVKTCHNPEHSGHKEKSERRKPKKSKLRGRKQKLKSSDCADNLLAELPFANAEIWKDLGFTTSEKNVKKKRKRGDSGRGESEEDGDKKKKKKPRPNYFVSIPITNPKIRGGIQAVQNLVIQKDHRYSRALVPVGSLHITLLVTYLSNEEEVSTAMSVVAQMKHILPSLLQGRELALPFSGIGNFRNEVVFAELTDGEHVSMLTEIAEAVRKAFEEKGVSSGDSKAFKPHLTFMKLSRAPKLRSQGIKKIDPELYKSFAEHNFGLETVSRLDLCSMLKKKSPDGYYHCETSVTFDLIQGIPRATRTSEKRGAEPDDEELLSLSKRLVEDAVLKAVQQYMEETQHTASGPDIKPGQSLNTSASTSK